MKDRKLILLVALGVLAVISLIYGIVAPSRPRKGEGASAGRSTGVLGSPKEFIPGPRKAPKGSHALWGRNPFLPKETSLEEGSLSLQLVLTGIAWDPKKPRAVINDRIVGIGSVVEGNKVVVIEKNRVVLNDGVSDFELRIGRKR